MRESPKYEKTTLPANVYEEWLKLQPAKITEPGRQEVMIQDSYGVWIEKRVEKHLRVSKSGK